MAITFKRRIENFTCEHCGKEVIGNGYTNHCPQCLWSKHVDVHPGDRKAECGGMMELHAVKMVNGKWQVEQRCVKCGHCRWNKLTENDNPDALIELSKKPFGDN